MLVFLKIREAIEHTKRVAGEHGFEAPVIGHAGDGNYHVFFHAPIGDLRAWGRLDAVLETITRKALELMRRVKDLFDPSGILNPGKVIPTEKRRQGRCRWHA